MLRQPVRIPPARREWRSPHARVRPRWRSPPRSFYCLSVPRLPPTSTFKRDDLADAAIKLEAQIKAEAGPGHQAGRGAAPRSRCGLPAQRFPHRHADSRPDRRGRARRQRQLAAAGADRPADPPGQRPRAHAPARARRDRRLHRLSAHHRSPARKPTSLADDRAQLSPTASSGVRRSMRCGSRSNCARSPTSASNTRRMRERSRLPPARLHGRCGRRLAARLLPVLGGAAGQAHRFLAVRGRRRPGSPALSVAGQAALRRRPEARRALQHHAARRHSVGGE